MSHAQTRLQIARRFSGLWRSQCSSLEKPHSEEYVPPHQSMACQFLAVAVSVISAASRQERWSHQK